MSPRRVAVVTGTRAEFGLLAPVIEAIEAHEELTPLVVASGAHFLSPARTIDDVRGRFDVAAEVPMQREGESGRTADALALARGIEGFTRAFLELEPDWVVVLGDRIEAFAAASAASVDEFALAHIHGGDRAEGVADEAMRHAITKLAHLHLAATETSAERICKMGEGSDRVIVTGSPAAVGAEGIQAAPIQVNGKSIEPEILLVLHPCGLGDSLERQWARAMIEALHGTRVVALHPNHDPDGESVLVELQEAARADGCFTLVEHVQHEEFRSLVRWLGESGGAMVGNSSAGLIDAAILQCPSVDVGPRQGGRERPGNVVHIDAPDPTRIRGAIAQARRLDLSESDHPYGAGDAHRRIASALADVDPCDPALLRKRNAY